MAAEKSDATKEVTELTRAESLKRRLTRRETLQLLGGAGAVLLTGCGGGGTPGAGVLTSTTGGTTSTTGGTTGGTATTGTTASTTGTTTGTTSKAVTPEGEIGPYFTDDSAAAFNRSNILPNIDGASPQTGIPLALTINVFDTQNNNLPIAGSQVDIWHCNAVGVYSNEAVENTVGQTWLRGYQITDANGAVTFNTIIPGWYQGRTQHIHLRVRSKYSQASSLNDGSNTTQVFFPQALLTTISTTVAPYNTQGINNTPNASDHVYTPETHALTELVLSGSISTGFAATFAIYLPITAE